MSENLYSWKFEDTKNRSQLWYIIALSIVIWLSIWWFFTKQYGMSFIVLLIAWLVFFVENNAEDEIQVRITENWIFIWESFYDYNIVHKFSIWYIWDSAEILRLHLNKKGIAILDLRVTSDIISDIQMNLSQFIEDAWKIELTQTDKLIRFLKL
jgi:hypothetical protein